MEHTHTLYYDFVSQEPSTKVKGLSLRELSQSLPDVAFEVATSKSSMQAAVFIFVSKLESRNVWMWNYME